MSQIRRPDAPSARPDATPAAWEAFVRRLKEREPEALTLFFDLYFERVYGHVRSMVGDGHLAEDLTQDVFWNVYRRLDRYDASRDVLPWLHTIATNKVRDYWRSRRHGDAQREGSIDAEDSAYHLPSEADGPDDEFLAGEVEEQVRRAVAELPKPMRDTVILRAFEGLPFQAIGDLLNRNEAAVRKRYSRALDLLRAKLGSQMTPLAVG